MNKDGIPNARFWIWYSAGDCWVKLTLRPFQRLNIVSGGPNEEGYSHTVKSYEHEGDVVVSEKVTNASDCDGPLMTGGKWVCPIKELRVDEERLLSDGVLRPKWRTVKRWQHDQFAEAMGY